VAQNARTDTTFSLPHGDQVPYLCKILLPVKGTSHSEKWNGFAPISLYTNSWISSPRPLCTDRLPDRGSGGQQNFFPALGIPAGPGVRIPAAKMAAAGIRDGFFPGLFSEKPPVWIDARFRVPAGRTREPAGEVPAGPKIPGRDFRPAPLLNL